MHADTNLVAAGRQRDAFESDDALQRRTEAVYAQLVAARWLCPWTAFDPSTDPDPDDVAARLLG